MKFFCLHCLNSRHRKIRCVDMNDDLKRVSIMFLRNAIGRILADRDIKRKEHTQLRKACEQAIEELNAADDGGGDTTGNVLPSHLQFVHADRYFLPFDLACHSKSPRIIVIALDCLQKLIAYGHLVGSGVDVTNPERLLIDRIVEAICAPFAGPNTDEGVQLQILKAILAVVLAPTCEVHEATLLLAVRTCFNIYLASRSPINQSTAKASLTQVINAVFGNMQKADEVVEHGEQNDENVIRLLVDSLIEHIAVQLDPGHSMANSRQSSFSSAMAAEVSMPPPRHLNPVSLAADSADAVHEDVPVTQLQFRTLQEKDAFLLFRALCRLSTKSLPERPDPTSHELRSKELSLEMLLLIVQNSSSLLHTSQPFILALRHYLCVSLSRNGVSPIVSIFEKSLAIFVQLVNKFKMHLKMQIEVFFKEIIFSILESSSSSFEHKWIVVNTLEKICEDPQSLVDIYVNYDCNLTATNIFERMVNGISKIAQGGGVTDFGNSAAVLQKQRERSMRILGLKCLVESLQCMVDWFDDVYVGRCGNDSVSQQDGDSVEGVNLDSSLPPHSPTVHQFEQLKQKKETIEHGIHLFAMKPKQGLKYLQEKDLVGTSPEDIAAFFHREDRLDKTVVGDYMGDGDDFNKKVMYAYIDQMDFSGKDFVAALRQFLDGFRLPGEAQKIDRLMEKFASRYCECNPNLGLFASADTAYVLAYSIIMLTTDLHSPQVRNKMTKEQYIAMNRGINDQSDLPQQYLSDIYDEIAGNEIKMKAGHNKLPKQNASATSERQRKLLQNVELAQMANTARALMEAASHYEAAFTSASHYEHVRPMFKIAWTPCLAAFSIGLQTSEDNDIISWCLQGFRLGIRIACLFRLALERNAYIQALARFTLLTAKNSMAEMKSKNIESIKLLMTVGDEDGNCLDESWVDVLKCISQLELAQLIGTGVRPSNSPAFNDSSAQYVLKSASHVDERMLQSLQECLGETTSQSVVVAVDKIFQGSSKLDGDAVVQFVRALCNVSVEELATAGNPRMFMLQKIVEISFYNMGRIRLQWSRIWAVLGEHFNKAGCNANEMIAHFAVDALRQLSMKFLERGELHNFRFQKDFLRPFEIIMNKNRSLKCRELVVACMTHMVNSHWDKIISGWKNVFSVFTMAAGSNDEDIVESAFTTTNYIITTVFAAEFGNALDSFQDAIKCLSEFACNANFPDISMEAIRLIRLCATYVSVNQQLIVEHQWEDGAAIQDTQRVFLRGWFPIMFELSCIIGRCKLDVRTRSLTVMFEIMKTYGGEFKDEWWKDLFQVAFRIFDVMKLAEEQNEKREWMRTTCNHALYAVVDVFTQYYSVLSNILLTNIYDQLYWCAQQENEQLARSAINCLENLILLNGCRFSSEMWQETISLIVNIFNSTLPHSLLTWEPDAIITSVPLPNGDEHQVNNEPTQPITHFTASNSDAIFSSLLVRCVVQLELVDAVNSIVFGPSASRKEDAHALPSLAISSPTDTIASPSRTMLVNGDMRNNNGEKSSNVESDSAADGLYSYIGVVHLLNLVDCLLDSHSLAKKFNGNNAQRTLLWKAGFKGRSKPNLLRQETHSMRSALCILFRIYVDIERTDAEQKNIVKSRLLRVLEDAVSYYVDLNSEQHRQAWILVLYLILDWANSFSNAQLMDVGRPFALTLCRLVECEMREDLRIALRRVLHKCICINYSNDA
uniref:Brefeldin A-inhibited guanine nucleotide-exchange protein 2 n=1 Tax=Ascaris suum TaxID=6253 RepID=F1KQQ2_ASCSU